MSSTIPFPFEATYKRIAERVLLNFGPEIYPPEILFINASDSETTGVMAAPAEMLRGQSINSIVASKLPAMLAQIRKDNMPIAIAIVQEAYVKMYDGVPSKDLKKVLEGLGAKSLAGEEGAFEVVVIRVFRSESVEVYRMPITEGRKLHDLGYDLAKMTVPGFSRPAHNPS